MVSNIHIMSITFIAKTKTGQWALDNGIVIY
jgi:hypothetical protein